MKSFWNTPFFIRLIGLLCLLGVACNLFLLGRDFIFGSMLWRLHTGFLLLYIGQVIFIFAQEKYVAVLTLLQAFAAFVTTADFIFTPVLQVAGLFYWLSNPPIDTQSVYKYLFISAALTLQLASAGYLWFYFGSLEDSQTEKSAAA